MSALCVIELPAVTLVIQLLNRKRILLERQLASSHLGPTFTILDHGIGDHATAVTIRACLVGAPGALDLYIDLTARIGKLLTTITRQVSREHELMLGGLPVQIRHRKVHFLSHHVRRKDQHSN